MTKKLAIVRCVEGTEETMLNTASMRLARGCSVSVLLPSSEPSLFLAAKVTETGLPEALKYPRLVR